MDKNEKTKLFISPEKDKSEIPERLLSKFEITENIPDGSDGEAYLCYGKNGLSLVSGEQSIMGDFSHLLPRLKGGGVGRELLVRAAKLKGADGDLTAVDATAGLGEDSFFLAAAGFYVTMFEKNPVIFELLSDAVERAKNDPALDDIVSKMTVINADSGEEMMKMGNPPDIILLDPMFPARQKSALVKKKLQMIQKLEVPCEDERRLVFAAFTAGPKRLIIKRPPKGPHLADIKPDYAIEGKAVRFDCIAFPREKIHKYFSDMAE